MSAKQNSKKFKWALDFNGSKNAEIPSPLGYNPSALVNQTEVVRDQRLVIKKSWDLALGPLKNIPMNLFIMYMSGNSISIFPIMMVGMMLVRPIKAMFTTQVTSKMAEGAQGTGQRIVYFLGNLANVALALYKCHSMGLLPTHASDWLAFVQPQTRLEYYGGGISFV
ncbi:ER membrane protein complex subunit 4 [Drosophila madeirensis]|uniref:ER membrane protein complex subunit 4 n=1 Tax=Drosophila madeirensis TaxID=30013 RepID=A0AAU9FTY3_DROMD|nr:ER membrane protein complex subunit 4 [Drosophila obscura]XP_034657169.1 ER membrane protein complex subunit 4 [Drosophila subobscura]